MPGTYQQNNSILGQSQTNPRAMRAFGVPDTDSREIKITGSSTTITPNFMFDHTFTTYISPVANGLDVNFYYPTKAESRSLHRLCLDNSNNTVSKFFTFSPEYVFLDDMNNTTKTYTVGAGKKQVWYGAIITGKLYLRVDSSSTN